MDATMEAHDYHDGTLPRQSSKPLDILSFDKVNKLSANINNINLDLLKFQRINEHLMESSPNFNM